VIYADDVNLLGNNIDTIKKNTETLTDASKDVSLEVNAKDTNYTLMSLLQNAGQNLNIKTDDISLKMWQRSTIWERQQQIKISFQNLFSSRLLS
jgi:hypothetical protein